MFLAQIRCARSQSECVDEFSITAALTEMLAIYTTCANGFFGTNFVVDVYFHDFEFNRFPSITFPNDLT